MKLLKEIKIEPNKVFTDGQFNADLSGKTLVEIYRHICGTYPKFFKMDGLCKLGFVAAEWLLSDVSAEDKANSSVILFNHGGSVYTDRIYEDTIKDSENYFPSPAHFVYTLANIVTGEIAIRHKIYGETSFYILDNEDVMNAQPIEALIYESQSPLVLTGWVDYESETEFKAEIKLISK